MKQQSNKATMAQKKQHEQASSAVRISRGMVREMKKLAADKGTTVKALVEEAIARTYRISAEAA